MSATAPADFWDKYHAEHPGEVNPALVRPSETRVAHPPPRRRHPLRALLRFLLTLGIGVGGTLAWQAYGDMAREMAATAYPEQLSWLMPPAPPAPVAATAPAPAAPATVGAAAPVPSPDQERLAAISLSIADVRRSVDILAAQVVTSQQQTAADIARLQASEQDVIAKLSAPPPRPPRPAPAPTHKPAPLALSPAAPPAAAH